MNTLQNLANINNRRDRGVFVAKNGLYANIHAKRERIAAGSGERMRKPGEAGAPTASQFKQAAKTAKAEEGMLIEPPEMADPPAKRFLPAANKIKQSQENLIFNPPVKDMSPAESTGTVYPKIAQDKYQIAQKQAEMERLYQEALKDKTGAAEELFNKKYNTSPHRYKYDTDPNYRSQVDKNAEETGRVFGNIDLRHTNVNSRKYANPNLAFMTQKGMSDEGRRALEESNLNIISSALPIPFVESVGKLPGLANASRNIFNAANRTGKVVSGLSKEVEYQKKLDDFFELVFARGSKNDNANEVVMDFVQRINTPEGMKRAKELGIDNVQDFLSTVSVVDRPDHFAFYSPLTNKIGLHPEIRQSSVKPITRHELEHAVQKAIKRQNNSKNISSIDEALAGLELRKEAIKGAPRVIEKGGSPLSSSYIDNQTYGLKDRQAATNYFVYGSDGGEKSAFLAELQQNMLDNGIIKHPYDKITPEMIKDVHFENMGKSPLESHFVRILDIMKPTDDNYKLLADNLNKMLALPPVIGATQLIKKNNP